MPVPLRTDFNAAALRAIARQTKDGPQARRLLALAAIYEGATRTEAARIGGVTVQIVRDWVVKVNAHGPEGLVNRKPPGQPSKLTDEARPSAGSFCVRGWCSLALSLVARRLRHGVPSRRNWRKVASTRTVSVGGWPGPRSRRPSQHSTTVAIRARILKSNAALPLRKNQRWAAGWPSRYSGQDNQRWMWKPPLKLEFGHF